MYLRFVLSVHIQSRAEEKTSHYNHCILGVQCIEYFFLPLSIICGTVLQFSNLLKMMGVMGCRCFVWFHYFLLQITTGAFSVSRIVEVIARVQNYSASKGNTYPEVVVN